jgi:lipopolysaccharide transport system ATP-binding protein
MDPEAMRLFDTVERAFTVRGRAREFGLVRLPHRWHTSASGDKGTS